MASACFFIWQHPAPFLDNNTVIAPLWGHGFTKTKAVTNVDNVGAYFSAYLGDMPLDEFNALDADEMSDSVQIVSKPAEDADGKKISKKIVKGGRLKLYPVGMNIIRYSRGVKRPDVEVTTYEEAQKRSATMRRPTTLVLNSIQRCFLSMVPAPTK